MRLHLSVLLLLGACDDPALDVDGGADLDCDADVVYEGNGTGMSSAARDLDGADPTDIDVTDARSAALFGPAFGGSHEPLTGVYRLTGLEPGTPVTVALVQADCSTTGCPATVQLNVRGDEDNGAVLYPMGATGPCGSVLVAADGDGHVTIRVEPGSSGGDDVGAQATW